MAVLGDRFPVIPHHQHIKHRFSDQHHTDHPQGDQIGAPDRDSTSDSQPDCRNLNPVPSQRTQRQPAASSYVGLNTAPDIGVDPSGGTSSTWV